MSMVRRIAVQNMKYHKSKNILIGIAIFLTTLLLFLVPTIGKDMIEGQYAVTNKLYPSWHALVRDVSEETMKKLSVSHEIMVYGLRSDVGIMPVKDAQISMMFLDDHGMSLYNMELLEGNMPRKENEIVVSQGILRCLGQKAGIGDTIKVPYQVMHGGITDYTKEKEFVVTGFLEDTAEDQTMFNALVSEDFLRSEVPGEEIVYRFLFQVITEEDETTTKIEERILKMTGRLGIAETAVRVNDNYLGANYVDPVMVPVIVGIMCIIVLAGVITIYSIYYVGLSDRVREFGKIKAMGASKKQLKGMVFWEGMSVAMIAMPIGLVLGTVLTKIILLSIANVSRDDNAYVGALREVISSGDVQLYHISLYVLAVAVTLFTVGLALHKPMRVVSKISEIEAIRFQGTEGQAGKGAKKSRKSHKEMSVFGLAKMYLLGKKKNSFITIFAMSLTGVFVIVVATVLSCADPKKSADASITGQYEISTITQSGNREHPEWEWSYVIKDNPLTEELKQQILEIEGVTSVVTFTEANVTSDTFDGETWGIKGVPEEYAEFLLDGIVEGSATYEDLKTGTKCILDKNMLRWFPGISLGDTLELKVSDGTEKTVEVEVIAISDFPAGFSQFQYLYMASEGLSKICDGDLKGTYSVFAKEKYNKDTLLAFEGLMEGNERCELNSWKKEYDQWKSALAITTAAAYAFLGILGAICIMNVINTMIHSVHIRKKEIGMMQAMGMTNHQLVKMLRMEGLFYTAGTLIISVGLGSLLGYPVFLTAKDQGWLNIREYHYPFAAVIIVALILLAVQMFLAWALGGKVKKESLIERIRYSE